MTFGKSRRESKMLSPNCGVPLKTHLSDTRLAAPMEPPVCEGTLPGAEAALPPNRGCHELMATDPTGQPSAQMWPAPGTSMVMSYGDQFADSSPFGSSGHSLVGSLGKTSQQSGYSPHMDEETDFAFSHSAETEGSEGVQYQFEGSAESGAERHDGSMTTRVLLGLDTILRDKVSDQVEEFRCGLDTLLDAQFHRIKHLIRLSSDFSPHQIQAEHSEVQMIETETIKREIEVPEPEVLCDEDNAHQEAELVKSELLLQLFTYANVVSRTLAKRHEFRLA